MAKEGKFNWFKNPEEQKNIEEKITKFENKGEIGNDDELKENLRIHELTTTGKKTNKELVEDEFTWEGKDIEEKAINISEKLKAEFERLEFELSQNKEKEMQLLNKEDRLYNSIKNLFKNLPDDKNLPAYKNIENLIDNASTRLDQMEKMHAETRKSLDQREEEIRITVSFLNKKIKEIRALMEPVHPKMN